MKISFSKCDCQPPVLTLTTKGEMSSLAEVGITISVLFGNAFARDSIVFGLLS